MSHLKLRAGGVSISRCCVCPPYVAAHPTLVRAREEPTLHHAGVPGNGAIRHTIPEYVETDQFRQPKRIISRLGTLWDHTVSNCGISVQQMLDGPYDPPPRGRKLDALKLRPVKNEEI
jgi:hypothetical protein